MIAETKKHLGLREVGRWVLMALHLPVALAVGAITLAATREVLPAVVAGVAAEGIYLLAVSRKLLGK